MKPDDPDRAPDPEETRRCSIGLGLGLNLSAFSVGGVGPGGGAPVTNYLLANNGVDILTTNAGDRLING